jgi:two-component system cell cycle response regulator
MPPPPHTPHASSVFSCTLVFATMRTMGSPWALGVIATPCHARTARATQDLRDGVAIRVGKDWRFRRTPFLAHRSTPCRYSISDSMPASAGQVARAADASAPNGRRLAVLVVDDDDRCRRTLFQAVTLLGHECRVARDGLDAWRMHQAEHADVILSDWHMPNVDGLELCKRTRTRDGETAYTYFILMTTFDDKEHFLRGMEAGADDYQAKPIDLDELQVRLVSAGRMIGLYRKLAQKNSALRHDSQASFRLARIDTLTNVANRRSMNEALDALWSRSRGHDHVYTAALCDVDWFKDYNDHLGHLAGDVVLRRIAAAIRDQLRQGDGCYRYGGEEFLIVLPEQSLAEGLVVAERVRDSIEHLAIPTPAADGVVTISIGVAALKLSIDDTPTAWLKRVDSALYKAKAEGRNRVRSDADVQDAKKTA